jgi:hypothetical protein
LLKSTSPSSGKCSASSVSSLTRTAPNPEACRQLDQRIESAAARRVGSGVPEG